MNVWIHISFSFFFGRGVRLIASAPGDFECLLRNEQMRGLLGGCITNILSSRDARLINDGIKIHPRRIGAPIFDTLVVLNKDCFNEWLVYSPVSKVVDAIYANKPYTYQRRYRDKDGNLYISLEHGKPNRILLEAIRSDQNGGQ